MFAPGFVQTKSRVGFILRPRSGLLETIKQTRKKTISAESGVANGERRPHILLAVFYLWRVLTGYGGRSISVNV
jgi:hypothetical protein